MTKAGVLLVAALVLCETPCALAQEIIPVQPRAVPTPTRVPPRRPYRGLFGSPAGPESKQALDLNLSAFGAYDQDVFAQEQGTSPVPGARESGWFGGFGAGVTYNRPGERFAVGLASGVGVNHYPRRSATAVVQRSTADLGIQLARRTRLGVSGMFMYSPEYRINFFNTADPEGNNSLATLLPDFDLYSLAAYRWSMAIAFTQELGQHLTLETSLSAAATNYLDAPLDSHNYEAGFGLTRRLTRNLGLRMGYGYSVAEFPEVTGFEPFRSHNIDLGVDYHRALSVSRRTTFSFGTGSAAFARNSVETQGSPSHQDFSYHVIGSANLVHEIGRTWTANAAYRRGIDFVEGFREPFLSDAIGARLAGFLTRRLRVSGGGDYSIGQVGVRNGDKFSAVFGTTGLQYGLSRYFAVFARYVYYRYRFDGSTSIDPRLQPSLNRNGLRFGVSSNIPLVR